MEAVEASNLLFKAVSAQKLLLMAVQTVCCVYTEGFWSQHKTHELQNCKDLDESVDLLIYDLLYSVCHQQDLQNSDHEMLNAKDKDAFCDFVEYVRSSGGHGLFCSPVQFASW